jgi:hypothetical protein
MLEFHIELLEAIDEHLRGMAWTLIGWSVVACIELFESRKTTGRNKTKQRHYIADYRSCRIATGIG